MGVVGVRTSMTGAGARARRGASGAVLAALGLAAAAPPLAAQSTTVASWQMNEAPGATTMRDSSGNAIHARIGSAVAVTGQGRYTWSAVQPNQPPPKPERLIQIDDPRLDPGTRDYAVTFRYRTTRPFGNIMQKGQATTRGGQWKVQLPQGNVSCLFRGSDGKRAVRSSGAYDDGHWHTVRCERTSTGVRLTIHDEQGRLQEVKTIRGATGHLANAVPMTVGGKVHCDQVEVTCDYFAGDIDFVRIDAS